MATHLRTELVADALGITIARRKPSPGLIHHSDRGVQYTALSFVKRLEEAGIVPSTGGIGSVHDNALAEGFVDTLKIELSVPETVAFLAGREDDDLRTRRGFLQYEA